MLDRPQDARCEDETKLSTWMARIDRLLGKATKEFMERKEKPAPMALRTPMRHDPTLVDQLQRANSELQVLFEIAAQAFEGQAFETAASGILKSAEEVQKLQRLEALRLYPPLVFHATSNTDTSAAIANLRQQIAILAWRFVRLCDELVHACKAQQQGVKVLAEAKQMLDRYIREKEASVYQAYSSTATVDGDADSDGQ